MSSYSGLLRALIFCVFDCGFVVRCAQEIADSSQVRIEKIYEIIENCRFGIHDLSRIELDRRTRLPRFNMPLELGVFLGAKRFGSKRQRRKNCLILEQRRYQSKKFVSDISGQDAEAHGNNPRKLVSVVRNWLRASSGRSGMPGGGEIWRRFRDFQSDLPVLSRAARLGAGPISFVDYTDLVVQWIARYP